MQIHAASIAQSASVRQLMQENHHLLGLGGEPYSRVSQIMGHELLVGFDLCSGPQPNAQYCPQRPYLAYLEAVFGLLWLATNSTSLPGPQNASWIQLEDTSGWRKPHLVYFLFASVTSCHTQETF